MSRSDVAHGLWHADLQSVIDNMQESVLVLASVYDDAGATVVDYRVVACNEVASCALGVAADQLVGCGLSKLFAADTTRLLFQLCAGAVQSGKVVRHFVAAPDPLTDLSRSPSIAVQVACAGSSILCTWLPGWLTETGGDDRRQAGARGLSTADHLELANVLDTLDDVGFGVFSLDLMTGRVIGSNGLYEMFSGELGAQRDEPVDAQRLVEAVMTDVDAWRDLIRTGMHMDVDVRLVPRLGGCRVRLTGRVFRGSDGHPAGVRGSVRLLER